MQVEREENLSQKKKEAGGPEFKASLVYIKTAPGQPRMHSETLSQKRRKTLPIPKVSTVALTCNLSTQQCFAEPGELKASMVYTVKPFLNTNKN